MSGKYYVSTPIYYVNDKPHLGHAYTTLCADVLARYHRLKGDEVFFLTGTDEHGAKVQQSAEKAGISPQEFVNLNAEKFKQAWQNLNIANDFFIRTSDAQHEQVVASFLQTVYDNGYIYDKDYEGLYCVGCEKFLQADDLVDDKCPYHPNDKPINHKEKNYFFKLKDFEKDLLDIINQGQFKIYPESRKNEILGKIKKGLEDVSISRAGVTWGVLVPWDKTQTVYVWVDALINYYSATVFSEEGKGFWPASLHLMAKDILWFHAIIWPALLLAWNKEMELPGMVAAHGFFTVDGQKMSKSIGNVIDPNDLIKEFGVDVTRYLLLSQIPFNNDGDISLERFRQRYDSDLANGLGNTFSRVTNMIEKFNKGHFEPAEGVNAFTADVNSLVENALRNIQFDVALLSIFSLLGKIDEEIENTKPWQMYKDGKTEEVVNLLHKWGTILLDVSLYLKPFMPDTAKKIEDTLRKQPIIKAEPLFPRLNQTNQ